MLLFALSAYAENLQVHEWGTFTAVAGGDGTTVVWHPLENSDLPDFVYDIRKPMVGFRRGPGKGSGRLRMETPVLYFYADKPVEASVRVDFPGGRVTEWYPMAKGLTETGIDWGTFLVDPTAEPELPNDGSHSHYYPARDVASAPVRVCQANGPTEWEKFLFYRGIGQFDLDVKVGLVDGGVKVDGAEGEVIVFENRDGKMGFTLADGDGVIARPELDDDKLAVMGELGRLLVAQGLYLDETTAMLRTWEDHWFEEGLRVFTLMGTDATNEMLPLTISPTPDELVRVMVGRVELLTETDENTALAILNLPVDISDAQTWTLLDARFGRFAEPLLRRVSDRSARAERLLTDRHG